MPDAVFFDILPRFDWAASEAGQKRLIGQFDSAAKQISRTFGLEAGNAAKGAVDKIAADMRKMQDEVATATTAATNDYRKVILAQGDLQASTLRVVEATEKFGFESSQATAALARQEAAIVKATTASDALTASTKREADATAAATALHAKHAEAVETSGSKAALAGAAFGTAGKVGLAAFAASVYETGKAAGDFQQNQERLVSSAGETQQGLQVVSDGILKLAGTVGYSSNELSKGMYTVESAGYRGADGIKVMTAAAQGAKAENADLAKVTDGLTTSMTDFGYKPEQAALVMSKLVTAVGESKANFEEFTGSLHSVEPAAASAGISIDDVYGSLARLTQSGTSADQATQNMADAIRHLQSASGTMRDEFAQLHLSVNDVQDGLSKRGLAGTMQLISDAILQRMGPDGKVLLDVLNSSKVAADDASRMFEKLPPNLQAVAKAAQASGGDFTGFRKQLGGMNLETRNLGVQWLEAMNKADGFSTALKSGSPAAQSYTTALQKATGDVAGMNVALQLTGPHADEANAGIKKVADTTADAGNKVKGFNETQSTLNAKLADAKAAWGAAAIQLGNDFIPELTDAATALSNVAGYLAQHKALAEDGIKVVGLLGGAWIVAKGIMVFGGAIEQLTKLKTAIRGVKTETDLTNQSLRGAAPAAAAGAVGVEKAAVAEVGAEAKVAQAAGEANVALAGGAAAGGAGALSKLKGAGGALLGAAGPIGWAALLSSLGDTALNTADSALGTNALEKFGEIPGSGLWIAHKLFGNDDAGKKPTDKGQDDGKDPGDYKSLDYNPSGAPSPSDQAAAAAAAAGDSNLDADPNAAPDDGSSADGGGGGSKDTATGPNVQANLPFHPIDLDAADKPAGQSYDDWISSQKAVQSAMEAVDKSALDQSQAQAHMAELLKKGHATQEEWNNAAEAVAKANTDNAKAQQDLTIAQNKQTADASKPAKKRDGEGTTGTDILTGDFDFSPKGITSYFTAMLADLAMGNPIGKSLAAQRGASAANPLFVSPVGSGQNLLTGASASASSSSAQALVGPGGAGTSPNGFPLNPAEQSFSVNGVTAQDAAGAPAQRLQQFAQWFNDNIEPVKELAGYDAGGHGLGNRSNHTSGTALDVNWGDFTALQGNGADARTHFSPDQMKAISQELSGLGMTWGQYWTPGSRDPGHFELSGADYSKNGPQNIDPMTGQPTSGSSSPIATSSANAVQASSLAGLPLPLPVTIVGAGMPTGAGATPGSGGTPGGDDGSLPAIPATDSASISPSGWSADWNAIAQKESGGKWNDNTGNGFSGGLQFTPSTWAANKPAGAPDQAWQASADQQKAAAENVLRTQGPGAWPNTFTPLPGGGGGGGAGMPFATGLPFKRGPGIDPGSFGADPGFTPGIPGAPGGPLGPQAPGSSPLGMFPGGLGGGAGAQAARRGAPAPLAPNQDTKGPSMPSGVQGGPSSVIQGQGWGAGVSAGKGFSTSVGSTLAGVAGMMFPGAGAAAAPVGALIDRTIGYIGQSAGIAASGLMETFLPGGAGDKLADPSKSWLGKLAIGFAGAHKADGGGDNRAGASAPPVDPNKDASKQATAAAPAAKMPDQPHQGTGAPPGPGDGNSPVVGTMNITQNDPVDGNAVGRDIARYSGSMGR